MNATMNPSIPEDARRSIAHALSRYYHELAGNEPPATPRFQFGRAINSMCTERGLADGYEQEICASAAMIAGRVHDPHRVLFPFSAFARDLTVTSAPAGGYLVGSEKRRPVDVLRSWSVVAKAGATILDGLVGNPSIPRVIAAAAASWGSAEGQQIPQNESTLGEAVATPKHATGYMRFSRQISLQADAAGFVEYQLLEAVGSLLDQAVIAGSGAAGQPTGITATPGVSAQPGAALSYAGVCAMRKAAVTAGALEDRLAWVGAPNVQETLSQRQRFTGADTPIWDGRRVLDLPANASKWVPDGTLIGGDWSRAIVCLWGPGFVVEIDPYTYFTTARIAARIILECDLVLAPANAFVVATSVS